MSDSQKLGHFHQTQSNLHLECVTLRHSSRYLSQDYIQKVQLRLRFQYKQCCICMIRKVQLRLKFQNKLYCICTSKLAQIHLKFLNFKLLWETPNSKSTQIQILIQTMIHLYHFRKFNWDRNFRTNYTTFVPHILHLYLKNEHRSIFTSNHYGPRNIKALAVPISTFLLGFSQLTRYTLGIGFSLLCIPSYNLMHIYNSLSHTNQKTKSIIWDRMTLALHSSRIWSCAKLLIKTTGYPAQIQKTGSTVWDYLTLIPLGITLIRALIWYNKDEGFEERFAGALNC